MRGDTMRLVRVTLPAIPASRRPPWRLKFTGREVKIPLLGRSVKERFQV